MIIWRLPSTELLFVWRTVLEEPIARFHCESAIVFPFPITWLSLEFAKLFLLPAILLKLELANELSSPFTLFPREL